jgi:3D (Asp-Asp-Asp) domain-containing protein
MCSKTFVPRAFTSALFFTFLGLSASAQTHLLGDAWKASSKSSTEAADKAPKASPASAPETPNQPPTLSSSWTSTVPVEPSNAPANPPLELEAEISVVKSAKLDALDSDLDEELVGLEPPRTFQATAYSLRGITRAGTYVRRGVIAADPRVLPLGSLVHLKAGTYSGVYSVQDTGKVIKGKRIDVWMPSSREARTFGRKNVRLTVLKYGGKRKPQGKGK